MEKTGKAKKIALSVFSWFLVLLGVIFVFLSVSEAVVDKTARTLPSYPREDLTEVLAKPHWNGDDLQFLYRQTGLGRAALQAMEKQRARIPYFQDALYYEGTLKHELAAFTTPHDYFEDYAAPIAPLEDGDVIVSSSCHTFGWRNGHAGIVVKAETQSVLQSVAPGTISHVESIDWFSLASNFIILRLKDVSKTERAEIAKNALEKLRGLPYTLFAGIFSKKDAGEDIKATNCSHLVYQAYKYFGYDIDSDGGAVCTARDIAKCDLFEVVQVYGFDPEKLW